MKNITRTFCALFLACLLLTGCGAADVGGVDFAVSVYKHINNGGVTADDTLPYNVDVITGATLTVEGPGVVTSIPLSVRELENRSEGLFRGVYRDSAGQRSYEGLDLYALLHDMVEGDNGILLTDTAYRVLLKNSNRATISQFTLADVQRAHDDGRPILLAYGVGTANGRRAAPFVFDAVGAGEHSPGYVAALDNDDGCVKLVYDADAYGENDYDTFSNVAYVYVCEAQEPGFKHSTGDPEGFAASRYLDYIVTFRGAGLGCELNLTTRQLEALVRYDENGDVLPGGLGYANDYSLANTSYWYVNRYEGLDLYKLLLYLGMADAETMGLQAARTTLIHFVAADGVASSETFSVDTLSYPDVFGFYNKNAADVGDGSYVSTNADLVASGYPVLLAYGVNNYPYTIAKTDPAYVSGLSNSGGPFRVVFGKTQYSHANGSNQVQRLSQVLVGEDVLYNTHAYTDNAAQHALSDATLTVTVNGEDGGLLSERLLTVGQVEDILYGADVAGGEKKAAQVKEHYTTPGENGLETAIYEGVDLRYFFMDYLGLPGSNGTVTFTNGTEQLTLPLEALFRDGYNAALGREGLSAILAFAKNGAPLVTAGTDPGYVDSVALHPRLADDPALYTVENSGGPLALLIPDSALTTGDGRRLENVTGITVDLVPDAYAHIEAPYAGYAENSVTFGGPGLEQERVFTVSALERLQTRAQTADFSLPSAGGLTQTRFRGLPLYELLTELGLANNAGDVTVTNAAGESFVFPLSRLRRACENWADPSKPAVGALLAFGAGQPDGPLLEGLPLVSDTSAAGYDPALDNVGGPLRLLLPQQGPEDEVVFVDNVTSIEVAANDVDTWSHSMSDVYEEFLDDTFTLTIKNDASEWSQDFTVAQLESLKELVVRDEYSVLDVGECEGLDIWKLIQRAAAGVPGAEEPVSITAYAADGYKNDLLSVFYKEGFVRGVEDENGNRRTLILCYAINGCPLVDEESHPGYTGLSGNGAGPLRVIAETNQGASVKYCNKLVVTLPGDGPINITLDPALFGEEAP